MKRYASSVINEERIGAIWYHSFDDSAPSPPQNSADDASESFTSLSSPHYVLIMSVTEEGDALCLVFTSKARNTSIARLPVRSLKSQPATMTGLQFDTFPRFFWRETWIHHNNLVYLPLTSLSSVADSVSNYPRLTRQDWAVLLFHNRPLKNCDIAKKFRPMPPQPPSPPSDQGDDNDYSHGAKQTPSSNLTYANVVRKNGSGGTKKQETWVDFVDQSWIHGYEHRRASRPPAG